jgi:thiamine transport system substrate-binding protein
MISEITLNGCFTLKLHIKLCGRSSPRKLASVFVCIIFISGLLLVYPLFTSGYQNSTNSNSTLTIYAYESLLNWGMDANDTNSKVFDAFEAQEGCSIQLEYFDDAGSALARTISEKNAPVADIIIGVDNVLIHKAKAQDILLPYKPVTSMNLLNTTVNGLDPDFYATPYDYGAIAIIYHKSIVNETILPTIHDLQLSDLITPDVAQLFLTEDPTLSSTGLGFLMWTIGIYDKVLGSDWEIWWNATRNFIQIEESWGDAFDIFYTPSANRPIMVSYGTDPAYNYLIYNDTSVGATVSHENGFNYAWFQIEGLGIVKGTQNLELAQKFIDWFTSETVQELIPENNWMYPVNKNAELPKSFDYAIDPSNITPLNDFFTPEKLNTSLDSWLETWEQILILGYTTAPTSFPPLFFLIGIICSIVFFRKRRNTN